MSVRTLFTRPWLSPNMLLKISATATGAMTKGSRTLMRQKVLARMLRSSIAAMKSARMSCGTVESRKMLNVLRSAIQNCGWLEDPDVLVEPDERAGVADQVPLLEAR